jgi:putative transposase
MARGVTIGSVSQAMKWVKEMQKDGWEWGVDWRPAARDAIRGVLETTMASAIDRRLAEMERLGQADRRNGGYARHLLTAAGDVEVHVPRTRTFSAGGVLRSYARREADVDRLILAAFVLGLSTRKVAEALAPILREPISAATVSRVAKVLDAAVASFHRRLLKPIYPVLLLDGVVLARKSGAGSLKRPVLVVLGIRPDGQKEILDFRLAASESEREWELFLNDLFRRGLSGDGLTLIGVDGGPGLRAALEMVYPGVPVQRCWAHKTRNVLDKVRKADREKVKRDLHRISHARNRVEARSAARRLADRWEAIYPKAVACLRDDLDELLAFFVFPDDDWRRRTRTTNAIERRFVEVRRRTRPMGVFSDRTSMERILFAVFTHLNRNAGVGTPFLALTQES